MRGASSTISGWLRSHPLAAVMLLALMLRLIAVQSRGFQYDDVFSIFLARRSVPEIISGTAADTMPPLYYLLLHLWMKLGSAVWFVRLPGILLSLGSVAILYHLVLGWFGKGEALWAALLAAVSPIHIYHAQDVRMYTVMVLGQIGFAAFFSQVYRSDTSLIRRRWSWIGLVISGLVAMYSHNLAVFGLLVPDIVLLLQRRWKLLAHLVGAQILIALGSLPWLVQVPGQVEKIQRAFWTPRPGIVEIVQAIILFTANLPVPPILMIIAAVLSFQALIMVAIEVWRGSRREGGLPILLALYLVPPAALFILSYLMRPVFVPRGFLVSSLAYFGLAGIAINRSWSRGPGKLIAGAFMLAAALTLPFFYMHDTFPRSPYRQAVESLRGELAPGEVIIHETKLSYFPAAFYAPDLPQSFLDDVPGSANDTFALASRQSMRVFPQPDIQSAANSYDGLYFITYSQIFDEYRQLGLDASPNLRWLEDHYQQTDRRVLNDLEIYHFER